ncbi:MAG TPA: hypothetical protein VE219_05120 [Candidatus Sulfotelmatobacter sp.]|nr:hypothetical protein [Candidatus Sulfotelmatobacter sp.]
MREGLSSVLHTIASEGRFLLRDAVEDDPGEQQIVPYCVVRHAADDTYLVTRRLNRSAERRLHDLYSLGVGGHINPCDAAGGDPVVGGLAREWAEEVVSPAPARARLIALLQDGRNPVSRVHLGLVFLVEPTWGRVSVRETDKLAEEVLPLSAIRPYYPQLETWSQLVLDHLVAGAAKKEDDDLVVQLAAAP